MTGYTVPIQKDMACANATEKISTVAAQAVSKKINGMAFKEAKAFLEKVVDGKASVNYKLHTNASECILALLKSAENNAVAKGIDTETLKVMAASHKGPKIFRGRRKRAFGMRMKSTHVQIVLKPAKMKIEKTKTVAKKEAKVVEPKTKKVVEKKQ